MEHVAVARLKLMAYLESATTMHICGGELYIYTCYQCSPFSLRKLSYLCLSVKCVRVYRRRVCQKYMYMEICTPALTLEFEPY